jgi:hypothetical protein
MPRPRQLVEVAFLMSVRLWSVSRLQSLVKFTYFLLDDFSVFTLSWSARYSRFQPAPPTWSSWPSAPGALVPPGGDDGQGKGRRIEEVDIGAGIKQQKVHFYI